MEMETSLEVLRFLASPFEGKMWKSKPSQSAESLLNTIMEKCTEKRILSGKTANMLRNGGPPSASWKFSILIVDLMLRLKEEIEETEKHQSIEERSIEVLSLQAQLDVQKCIELLVGFGIVPYLLQGVGVPEKIRKSNPLASELFLAEDRRIPHLMQFHRLAQIVEVLLEVSSCPSLNSLIVPKHAADILAALLQICKSPIAKPQTGNGSESAKSSSSGSLTQLEYNYVISIRQRLEILMKNFLKNLPRELLINSIFLVGATEKPKWIRKACNEMLCEILLSPNGLILISSTLLNESSASNVWKLARVISSLMRDAITRNNEEDSQVERLTGICAQCVQMIICTRQEETTTAGSSVTTTKTPTVNETACTNTTSGNTIKPNDNINLGKESRKTLSPFGVNQELSRIGLFCSIALMEINCQIVKRLVWDHLFNPVLMLVLGQSQMKPISGDIGSMKISDSPLHNSINEDIISSVDIEKVIVASGVAEVLLSLVIPMGISLPLSMFQPVWSLLFQIFVACKRYLERKIQEPIVSQLAQLLGSKLENILILLLEIVSSGAGNKLDLCSSCSSTNGTKNSGMNQAGNSIRKEKDNETKIIINNISEERAKTVCDFCIQLVLNENEQKDAIVNKFELVSSLPSSEDERESVKIVRVCQPATTATTSDTGCQSKSESNNENAFELIDYECSILCSSILKHERVESITSELFCQLLSYNNELEIHENGNSLRKEELPSSWKIKNSHASQSVLAMSSSSSSELTQLELEEKISRKASLRKFIILKLLGDLGGDENVVEKCVKTEDYKESLKLVELIMRKLTSELKSSNRTGEDFEFSQSVMFALGILGTIVETATTLSGPSGQPSANLASSGQRKYSSSSDINQDRSSGQKEDTEFWDELKIFVPHLEILQQSNHLGLVSAGIPSMAENILISIETQGSTSYTNGKKKVQIVSSRYVKALEDVANPMLPIKGHGLLQLRRLIEEKDPETIKNDADLLQIFQKELINEDSYVYLMAIQGLAALGNKFHKIVVPILIQEYDFINPDQDANGCRRGKMYQVLTADERIECRMKIGEVLVKIIQKLGDIAPLYRVPLTNLFFRVVRDDEPLIRASALSNLGELCHLLKFSLGSVLTEVWYCIESLLNCEKDIHVRRAALHLLVLLLKGVEKDFSPDYLLKDAQLGTYLRDVRRLLTRIEQRESDSVSKTHAQLALHELELIVKKLIRPMEALQYKISLR